jgi:tetratricopeptide (TPR) repeat protein
MASSSAGSLTPIYWEVRALSYTDPRSAIRRVNEVYARLRDDLEAYIAPPDIWFNMSIVCSRLRQYDAEAIMWDAGLHAWPDDVDLLCSLLQEYYGAGNPHYDPKKADAIWGRLSKMPPDQTGPYWRFWVFGAQYYVRLQRDTKRALEMLETALRYVRRDFLMDVLRAYRSILVDSVPANMLPDPRAVEAYQEWVFNILQDRWLFGIRLGVENGYVLALELGKLYQERVGYTSARSPTESAPLTTNQVDYLNKALTYLDLAERLYTGDTNHPIDEIYVARVRVLMALRSYGEALNLMRSLPQNTLDNDASLALMLRYARAATGAAPDEGETKSREEIANEVIEDLFDPGGENLTAYLASRPAAIRVIIHVLNEMRQAQEEEGRS